MADKREGSQQCRGYSGPRQHVGLFHVAHIPEMRRQQPGYLAPSSVKAVESLASDEPGNKEIVREALLGGEQVSPLSPEALQRKILLRLKNHALL